MSFVYLAALLVAVLVVAPTAAHLLRRRKATQQPFPPAALAVSSPPAARRRSKLEDRSLFAIRALAILALALLGATPLVRCSRLTLGRKAGGSFAVAIVIDDSLTMRARSASSRSRFDEAKRGAKELIAGAREGDAISVVLAGSPARLVLAATTDLATAASAIDAIVESDRATDLDAAITLGSASLQALPHTDKRVVVLSDRCDGRPEAAPIGEGRNIPVWLPLPPASPEQRDCAIVRSDRKSTSISVRVACSSPQAAQGRNVEALSANRPTAAIPLPALSSPAPASVDVTIELHASVDEVDSVRLVGPADAIASDDVAEVTRLPASLQVVVVADRSNATVVTGGPPAVEQAISSLDSGAVIRPLPAVPDTADDLAGVAAVVMDDPPGLSPESRRVFASWLERGGVALLALGPRAASAPLGTSLEPFLPVACRWDTSAPDGIDLGTGGFLGPSAESLLQLRPSGRAHVQLDANSDVESLIRWPDAIPWLMRRHVGRGTAFTLGLPMQPDASDLVVRPAFLALLDTVIEHARAQGGGRRIEAGGSWAFAPNQSVEIRSADGPVPVDSREGRLRAVAPKAGRYDLRIDGVVESRYATIPEREVDFRPRRVREDPKQAEMGDARSTIDVSRYLAFVLLGLLAAEVVVRLVTGRTSQAPQS